MEAKSASGRNATIMTSRTDVYNLIILFVASLAISGIISIYIMGLAWLNLKTPAADPLKRAAWTAASDLLKINVFSRDFGTLGIADYFNNDNNYGEAQEGAEVQVRSFNTVSALIRTALFVARRYHLEIMGGLAANDMRQLLELEDELHQKLLLAIKDDGTGKIYEHVKRVLTVSTRGGEHLLSLKLKLGTIKNKLDVSQIPAEQEDKAADCSAGQLKTLTPLTVPYLDRPLLLHQQSGETIFLNTDDFVEAKEAKSEGKNISPAGRPIPTVVLIEAQFTALAGKGDPVTRKVCVAVGDNIKNNAYAARQLEGSLAVSFPQGRPDAFSSLESILLYKDWQGRGDWLQAAKGSVPGTGQLAPWVTPANEAVKAMNGSESLSIAFYHWLRQLSNPVDPAQLSTLIKTAWNLPRTNRSEEKKATGAGDLERSESNSPTDEAELNRQVNSGLVKNSDARFFALLNQSKPTEAGQKALMRCFQARPNKFASSTLPLVVDSRGLPNLPGRSGFDQHLAFDLLTSIYSTNLAAQDSLAIAKLIHSSAVRSYRASKERLFLAETDLDSLSTRLKTVEKVQEAEAIRKEIDWRNNRIAYELNEQKRQMTAVNLAQQAIANANSVAEQSFECGSKLFQLAGSGINRLDNFIASSNSGGGLKSGYLLGKRYIFTPVTDGLNENEIFEEAAKAFESAPDKSDGPASPTSSTSLSPPRSPWLAKKAVVFAPVHKLIDTPETQFIVEGRPLAELKAESPPVLKAEAATIVFTPSLLIRGAAKAPLYFKDYPFRGLPVAESQLINYCQNAFRTIDTARAAAGGKSRVAWSVLTRDLVANRGINSSHQRLGLPLVPSNTGWCKRALNANLVEKNNSGDTADSCPGLAAEWQLRAPVMILDENEGILLKSTTLSDPASGQRLPQIPPISPDLM